MIITFSSKAGGVGKTTLATNIAAKLSLDKKVLLLDLDFKSNISITFGKDPFKYIGKSFLSLVQNIKSVGEVIDKDINQSYKDFKQKNPKSGDLNIIYSEPNLKKFDSLFNTSDKNSIKAANILQELNKTYDFIVIDTPNELCEVTKFALSQSDKIVIPFEPKIFTWKSSFDIVEFLEQYSKPKNNTPVDVFILPNKFNEKSKFDNKYLALAKNEFRKYSKSLSYIFHFVDDSIRFSSLIDESIETKSLPFIFNQEEISEWEHLRDLFENAL